jgi:hypothetical protein
VQQAPVGEWRGWASPMCGEGAGVGVAADAGVRRPSAKKGKNARTTPTYTHILFGDWWGIPHTHHMQNIKPKRENRRH